MPRTARKRSNTGTYHIMLRGINRQTIFENDADKNRFIVILSEYNKSEKFRVFGYCLMDNHVHLLIQEGEDDISTVIKRISSSYVYWYNNKHERVGHLFQERFKSECVEDDNYFLAVLRYIHQNPVKAGMVTSIDKYNWSSYNDYIRRTETIDFEYTFSFFSEDITSALKQFIIYMNNDNKVSFMDYNDFSKLTDIEVIKKFFSMGIKDISSLRNLEKKREILF